MSEYKAVTSLRCGKTYKPGEIIRNGVLSLSEIENLVKLGSIELVTVEVPIATVATPTKQTPPTNLTIPPPPNVSSFVGIIADKVMVLEYVNGADQAGLERIKGVGSTTAKAMASHGKFASIAELNELVGNINWDSIEIV